jgi:phenylacetate-CoA ligase
MNPFLAKYLLYYPVTLINRENILYYQRIYNRFQWLDRDTSDRQRRHFLSAIFSYAKENSHYYHQILHNIESVADFGAVPFLTKQLLINEFKSICTPTARKASLKTTGGSTGEPVLVYKNADALARERAATWRSYEWAGIHVGEKQARFWGTPHSRKAFRKAILTDFISNRKRLSAFNLTEKSLYEYYRTLQRFNPRYLYGYVSMIKTFCDFLKSSKLAIPVSVTAIITTSEVLSEADRSFIESVCKVKVFNEYGCGEVGSIAHECEYGSMHIMSDNLWIEVVDQNGEPAVTGEVVVTDFFNQATPLIRYRLGDFATLSEEPLPVRKNVAGTKRNTWKSV